MLTDFANAHPVLFAALLWPLLSALVTGLFGALGHLSAADYAKLPAPVAFVLRAVAASGFDAPKVLALIGRLFGKGAPPVAGLLLVLGLASGVSGCAWFQANQQALVPLEVDTCVFGALEAGMAPNVAAAFCKVAVDYVNTLVAKKDGQKARASRELAATLSTAKDGGL